MKVYVVSLSFILLSFLGSAHISLANTVYKPIDVSHNLSGEFGHLRAFKENLNPGSPTHSSQNITEKNNENNSKKSIRKQKLQKKVERFLDSKFGKWILKRAAVKAKRKEYRQELKNAPRDKETRKALKNKFKEDKIKAKNDMASLTGNMRLGIIIALIGVILVILPSDPLRIIGTIMVVVGLVLILLDLI